MSAVIAILLLLAVCLVAGAGGGVAGVALGTLLIRREFLRRMDMLKFSGPLEPQSAPGTNPTEAGVTPGERDGSADATDGGRPEDFRLGPPYVSRMKRLRSRLARISEGVR